MQQFVYTHENDNKNKGFWISLIFHILLLFLFLVPCFQFLQNQPQQPMQGIIVAFGNPEAETKTNPRKSEKSEDLKPEKVEEPKAIKEESKPVPSKNSATTPVKVVSKIVDNSEEIAATKKRNEDRNAKAEEDKRKLQAQLEEERAEMRRREEAKQKEEAQKEEARKKAEEKANAKSKFSSLFGNGDEDAKDSKGQANGKPDASALEGLNTGSGKVGDGLGERGVTHTPKIVDNTQKTGRVVVNICVNQNGDVISANYRQKGSTTTDAHLIDVAEKNAKKYKFSKSKIVEQCGNVIIDFKLK